MSRWKRTRQSISPLFSLVRCHTTVKSFLLCFHGTAHSWGRCISSHLGPLNGGPFFGYRRVPCKRTRRRDIIFRRRQWSGVCTRLPCFSGSRHYVGRARPARRASRKTACNRRVAALAIPRILELILLLRSVNSATQIFLRRSSFKVL